MNRNICFIPQTKTKSEAVEANEFFFTYCLNVNEIRKKRP